MHFSMLNNERMLNSEHVYLMILEETEGNFADYAEVLHPAIHFFSICECFEN